MIESLQGPSLGPSFGTSMYVKSGFRNKEKKQ